MGVQLFSGALNRRCASLDNPNPGCHLCGYDVGYGWGTTRRRLRRGARASHSYRNRADRARGDHGGGPRASKYLRKAKPSGYSCPDGQWCIAYELNHDITSFDNILGAWLAIFQCISLEGWVDIMYWTQDAVSEWSFSWYFVVMIIIGSFFAINLALAVLYVSFTTERKTDKEQHSDAIAAEKEANSKLLKSMESEGAYQAAQVADLQRRLSDASPGRKSAPPSPSMSPHASFVAATPPNGDWDKQRDDAIGRGGNSGDGNFRRRGR